MKLNIKYTTQLRLEPNDAEKISFIAKQTNRSLNNQIQTLVKECIYRYEKKNGKITLSSH
jgi:hypothetical protein